MMFALPGFEHAIANMFFVSNGLFHGADITVGWMLYNQSAAILGNFIGGALLIGTSEHAMNHWVTVVPWERGHAAGTLAAHDVESSRKANEYRPQSEKQQMKDLIRSRTRSRSMTVSPVLSANGTRGVLP
jgi:formate transporter